MEAAATVVGLATSAYLAQAWLADSPYLGDLSHQPLLAALVATASVVDGLEVFKFVVIAGTSMAVVIDGLRRLFPACAASRPATKAVHTPSSFKLETAR
jgi:hypothetical protein